MCLKSLFSREQQILVSICNIFLVSLKSLSEDTPLIRKSKKRIKIKAQWMVLFTRQDSNPWVLRYPSARDKKWLEQFQCRALETFRLSRLVRFWFRNFVRHFFAQVDTFAFGAPWLMPSKLVPNFFPRFKVGREIRSQVRSKVSSQKNELGKSFTFKEFFSFADSPSLANLKEKWI